MRRVAPTRLSAGARLGIHEVRGLIGEGGMGAVYRARDTRLGRDVAIKVLLPAVAQDAERLARFQREAQVLAALNDPHIAHLYGLEDGPSGPFLVMELVEGPTLADRIAHGPIPLGDAIPIVRQIAEALEVAHEQGIVHRDLKPANIKVRDDGSVKVLDFGLATGPDISRGQGEVGAVNSPTITSPAALTGVGMLLGTAAYMSPEQARGHRADKRSDIWALGCVFYEMLTGKRAFDGEDMVEVLGAVVRLEPDWAAVQSDVTPAIVALLRGCLVKDRRERVADISIVLFVLGHAASLAGPSSTTALDATVGRKRWRKTVALSTALVVGAAASACTLSSEPGHGADGGAPDGSTLAGPARSRVARAGRQPDRARGVARRPATRLQRIETRRADPPLDPLPRLARRAVASRYGQRQGAVLVAGRPAAGLLHR